MEEKFHQSIPSDKPLFNVLKNNMYLPLAIDEGIYLRGALKMAIRNMKQGDEREFVLRVLDRLNDILLDVNSYNNILF